MEMADTTAVPVEMDLVALLVEAGVVILETTPLEARMEDLDLTIPGIIPEVDHCFPSSFVKYTYF